MCTQKSDGPETFQKLSECDFLTNLNWNVWIEKRGKIIFAADQAWKNVIEKEKNNITQQ